MQQKRNKIFKSFLLILLSLNLVYCTKSDNDKMEKLVENIPEQASASEFECYYFFNEKYEQERGTNLLQKWQDSIISSSVENGIQIKNSLFLHNGGGPAGAEWNSTASLFCLIKLEEQKKIEINLNDKIVEPELRWTTIENERKYIVSFVIESEVWQQLLTPIQKEDYEYVYTKEQINELSEIENSQIGIGKILKIALLDKETKDTIQIKAFHVAYGE